MRQIFTSPRLENVERVAKLLEEAGIDTKITEGRSYKNYSRREFSYNEKKDDPTSHPAVWVLKSDDYKQARELLHEIGLLETTQVPSYLPETLQARGTTHLNPQQRLMRIRLVLLLTIGALAGWMAFRIFIAH